MTIISEYSQINANSNACFQYTDALRELCHWVFDYLCKLCLLKCYLTNQIVAYCFYFKMSKEVCGETSQVFCDVIITILLLDLVMIILIYVSL